MGPISNYKIVWNTPKNEGILLVDGANGIEQILVDSAKEAMLLVQQLRMEQHSTLNQGVLAIGFTPSGVAEASTNTTFPKQDNLQLLDQVDATIEAVLHAKGIYTFKALIAMDQSVLRKIYVENR